MASRQSVHHENRLRSESIALDRHCPYRRPAPEYVHLTARLFPLLLTLAPDAQPRFNKNSTNHTGINASVVKATTTQHEICSTLTHRISSATIALANNKNENDFHDTEKGDCHGRTHSRETRQKTPPLHTPATGQVQSLTRGLKLLGGFAESNGSVALTELAYAQDRVTQFHDPPPANHDATAGFRASGWRTGTLGNQRTCLYGRQQLSPEP